MSIIGCLLIVTAAFYCCSVLYLLTGLFRLHYRQNDKIRYCSIIVAVHNEEECLQRCLNSLISQNYPPDKFEVIIADDRSDDSTPLIISDYCSKYPNFRSVSVKPGEDAVPKKTALIRALDVARGEIILSTDGDCEQSQGWIRQMAACFTDGVGMVIGHVGYFKPQNLWQGIDAMDYLTHRALGAAFIGVNSVYTCTAANMAYRKEIFDRNREGFKSLKIRPAEDNFILHCSRNSGFKIAVATHPDSVIETQGAKNFPHFMNQRFRWAAYGGNITTRGVKLFFIPALLFYLFIWVGFFYAVSFPDILPVLLWVLTAKMCSDFLLIFKYVHIYKIQYMIRYFLPLSLIHLILAPLVALKGNLFSFTWKNKRYTKECEIGNSASL